MNMADRAEQPSRHWRTRLYNSYASTHAGRRPGGEERVSMFSFYDANIAGFLPADRNARILDVACGQGAFISYLLARGYKRVCGIDISKEQVEHAVSLGLEVVSQADAGSYLSGTREQFDVITAFDFIEHLTRDELFAFLDLSCCALRPGGTLIVQTINGSSPFSGRFLYGDLTHERAYTARSIRQAFASAGLGDVRVQAVKIPVYGIKSAVRRMAWYGLNFAAATYVTLESGSRSGDVFTQDLIASGARMRARG
jgi:2-polyprenyl-3-methyl-5-hydroxy-6-metoxy-1,4-benzoquinol methylase